MDEGIMVPDEVLSRRVRVVIVLSSLTIAVGLLTIGSLKSNCHITFMHAFSALRCIFEDLTLLTTTKVISLRMHWDADNTCVNGKSKLALR